MNPKHQILTTAALLFSQKGFAATSMREIAQRASVNLAMINYYFRSKENLLENIMQTDIERVLAELERIMQEDLSELDKIYGVIDTFATHLLGNRNMARLLFQEQMISSYPATHKMLRHLGTVSRQNVEQLVASGQQKKLFAKDINPSLLYSSLVGTIQQFMVHLDYVETGDEQSDQAYINRQIRELTAYLKILCNKLLLA